MIKDGYFYGMVKPMYAKPKKPTAFKTELRRGEDRFNYDPYSHLHFVTLKISSDDRFFIEDVYQNLRNRYMIDHFWESWRMFWDVNEMVLVSKEKTTQDGE